MKYKDYYAVLGIAKDATLDQVKKAYRLLAKKHHPDMSKEPGAEERFKEAAEAYACLKNLDKRAAYDALGKVPPDKGFAPGADWARNWAGGQNSFEDMDFADLFAAMNEHAPPYGANYAGSQHGQPRRPPQPVKGHDLKDTVRISMVDSLLGCKRLFNVKSAGGEKTIEVTIPPGVRSGQNIRLRAMGGLGQSGGDAGDMYLHIELLPHKTLKPLGDDLYFDMALTPWEAVLGAEIEVATLQEAIILSVPHGTLHSQKLRIKGRGLPANGGKRGDLFAVVHIETPAKVTDEEKLIYQSLAKISNFNPRQY